MELLILIGAVLFIAWRIFLAWLWDDITPEEYAARRAHQETDEVLYVARQSMNRIAENRGALQGWKAWDLDQ